MDPSEPSAVICPTLDGPVLTVLARTTRPLSAREVSRLVTRGSWGGVRKALLRLTDHGIVSVQEAGNASLFTLNRRHLAAPAVEVLAGLRTELIQRLSAALGAWSAPPLHASLFGSMARGDGDTTSDVDLLLVRPREIDEEDATWRAQLDGLAADVLAWSGNHAGLAEIAESELEQVRRSALGRSLQEESITLLGPDASAFLGSLR